MGLWDLLPRRGGSVAEGTTLGPVPVECRVRPDEVAAPVSGSVMALEDTADPVFSQGMMGPGAAIRPEGGVVYAPCAGAVFATVSTGHAVDVLRDDGLEVLVHVGVDTVDLRGAGFTCLARKGDRVECGQPLIAFDREGVEARGLDDTVMVACPNLPAGKTQVVCGERAVVGEALLRVVTGEGTSERGE